MYRYWTPTCIIVFLILNMVACAQFTPPGPNALGGSIDQTSYLLLDWPEGLRILIWDDVFEGRHGNHAESATNDHVYHQSGGARSVDGRRYEYSLETRDGLQADFTIDGSPYDLDQGKLFLIRTAGGVTQVEQLDLDLSGLSPTNAGIEDFGRQTIEIARFFQSITNVAARENCSGAYGASEPPTVTTPPADPLPHSLKGYVLQSYCWDGQWYFTLTVGRNAVNVCDSSEPIITDNVRSHTMKGVQALKEALDQLQPGERVTWCSSNLPDADVIDDMLSHSRQSGLELSVWTDQKPSPTVAAPAPATADPTPTADLDRRPDLLMAPSPAPGLPSPVIELARPLYSISKDHVSSSGTGKSQGVWRLDPGGNVVKLSAPPELNITSFDLWPGDGRRAYGTSVGQIYLAMPDGQIRLLHDAGLEAGETVQISSVARSPEGDRLAFSSLLS